MWTGNRIMMLFVIKPDINFLHIFMGFWLFSVSYHRWIALDQVKNPSSLHESCCWSDIHKKWFFLPRRMSKEPYDKDLDEYRCGNILICADSAFQDISVISIGNVKQLCTWKIKIFKISFRRSFWRVSDGFQIDNSNLSCHFEM